MEAAAVERVRRLLLASKDAEATGGGLGAGIVIGRNAHCGRSARSLLRINAVSGRPYSPEQNDRFIASAVLKAMQDRSFTIELVLSKQDYAALLLGQQNSRSGAQDAAGDHVHRGTVTYLELCQLRGAVEGQQLRCYRHSASCVLHLRYGVFVAGSGAREVTPLFHKWLDGLHLSARPRAGAGAAGCGAGAGGATPCRR